MNKLTILGVPIHRLCVIVMFLLMSSIVFAQEETYTTIRKNVNPLAFDLDHNLSSSQDSLVLENKYLFKKVRFLNNTIEKVFEFKPAVKRVKIPLDELPLGSYTVMFYQADKIIVFQIDRILPFDYKSALDTRVALNDELIKKVTDTTISSDVINHTLDYDSANLSLTIANADNGFETLQMQAKRAYNISDPNRSNMISRVEYRRTHLRPNGKPYTD
ncbi:hypothetical protein [Psychroserpens luteolus]|uniref:hypothetical protein n=1 Tax=Psychroserpens luteolus TaxID=2855840 RepID=UPI001E336CDC|nr:hypothetical protein [Psychroserpens luteolus]MCD2260080.1 hypothetical protein [Psychroserpens luteolus]